MFNRQQPLVDFLTSNFAVESYEEINQLNTIKASFADTLSTYKE